MNKITKGLRTEQRERKNIYNPRTLVMEKDTYSYFRQQDRYQEKQFINHLISGVER